MKLYYVMWQNSFTFKNFVIIDASDKKEADIKFRKWRDEHRDIAPDVTWSQREVDFEDCIYLNKER